MKSQSRRGVEKGRQERLSKCFKEKLGKGHTRETRGGGVYGLTYLLPEETLPSREVRSLEQRVLEDTLDTAKSGNDVDSVVVELPELAVVSLRRPPEGIRLEELVLLPVGSNSPSLVVGERVSVLLEERVDSRNSSIPVERE